MPQLPLVRPQLGRKSMAMLGLWVIAMVALLVGYRDGYGSDTPADLQGAQLASLSMIYGTAAGLCWILSLVQSRSLRWTLQVAVTLAAAALLAYLRSKPTMRYVAAVGGIVLGQSVLFTLLRIPTWETSLASRERSREESSNDRTRARFGIGDLLAVTTAGALLLGIAIRYHDPSVSAARYWAGSALLAAAMPAMAAALIFATLTHRGWLVRATLIAAVVLLAICSSAALGLGPVILRPSVPASESAQPVELAMQHALIYCGILLIYAFSLAVFAAAGRWQAAPSKLP